MVRALKTGRKPREGTEYNEPKYENQISEKDQNTDANDSSKSQVEPNNDFCMEYLKSLDWNRPIKRTTDMSPWIDKDEWKLSLAHKYMNYEMEKNYIDLDNPLYDGPMLEDLRKKESRKKNKKKDVPDAEYSVIKEGVVEVDIQEPIVSSDSEDNFIDEFGNIREQVNETSDEETQFEKSKSPMETKKRKRQKKGKRKGNTLEGKDHSNIKSSRLNEDQELKEEVLQQSSKLFIDYDKAPQEGSSVAKNQIEVSNILQKGLASDYNELNMCPEPQLVTTFQFEEPKNSLLSTKEQHVYMALLEKFRNVSQENISTKLDNPTDTKDWEIFQSYRDLIQEEQQDFLKWCKEVFVQHGNMAVEHLPSDVRRYIDEYYKERLQRVPKSIPRLYQPISYLNGTSNDSSKSLLRLVPMVTEQTIQKPRFEMRLEKDICQLGSIPKIIIPNEKTLSTKNNIKLPTEYQKLCDKYPPKDSTLDVFENSEGEENTPKLQKNHDHMDTEDHKLYKTNISSDSNAEKLALAYKPDIVISTGALKVIINNFGPNFDREWEIPVTVWLIPEGRRVIFIDKPLPRKKLTILDKKIWHSKIATKSFLLHPSRRSGTRINNIKKIDNVDKLLNKNEQEERHFKEYDDLSMFQLDGMDDGNSSSDEDAMVIDEGILQGRANQNFNDSNECKKDGLLQEANESDDDLGVIIPSNAKIPDSVRARLGIDEGCKVVADDKTRIPKSNSTCNDGTSTQKSNSSINDLIIPISPQIPKSPNKKLAIVDNGSVESKVASNRSTRSRNVSITPDKIASDKSNVSECDSYKRDPITKQFVCTCGFSTYLKKDIVSHQDVEHENNSIISNKEDVKKENIILADNLRNKIISSPDVREGQIAASLVNEQKGRQGQVYPLANEVSPIEKNDSSSACLDQSNIAYHSKSFEGIPEASKILGSGNKLDEILQRTQREKYQRGRLRGGRSRGRARSQGNKGYGNELTTPESNVLSGIIASQTRTSHVVKNEHIVLDHNSIRDQMHQYQGKTNLYAEIGDAQKDYKQPTAGANVNYSLWKLGRKTDPNLNLKPDQKSSCVDSLLSILVRSNFHGVRLEANPYTSHDLIEQLYTVDCKLENQVRFGAEMVSQSELAKQWMATMLRPKSKLARLRASSSNGSILMTEIKSLKELTKDGLKVNFKPDEALGNLYTLFTELKKLPNPTESENGVARYLLQHDFKTGAFVMALKSIVAGENLASSSSNVYDAHMAYNIHSNEEVPLPPAIKRWIPIDVDLITPYHRSTQKVPGLFTPKQYNNNNGREDRKRGQTQRGRGNRGRRGRRMRSN